VQSFNGTQNLPRLFIRRRGCVQKWQSRLDSLKYIITISHCRLIAHSINPNPLLKLYPPIYPPCKPLWICPLQLVNDSCGPQIGFVLSQCLPISNINIPSSHFGIVLSHKCICNISNGFVPSYWLETCPTTLSWFERAAMATYASAQSPKCNTWRVFSDGAVRRSWFAQEATSKKALSWLADRPYVFVGRAATGSYTPLSFGKLFELIYKRF